MTWSFLAPLYLAGAIALAIPIWVHLRRKSDRIYLFPTLRFLVESRFPAHSWRQIIRWLVLFLRIFALAALVLAFARPWRHIALPASGHLSVLLLDVSSSMKAEGAWENAHKLALEWLESEKANARTSVILIGRNPRTLLTFDQPPSEQKDTLQKLVPTYESTNPEAALRAANQLLSAQPATHKKITVISDMAAIAWKTVRWNQPLSPGVAIEAKPIQASTPSNTGIVEVRAPPAFWAADANFPVTAVIRNFSSDSREVGVSCEINGQAAGSEKLILSGNGTREVIFRVSPGHLGMVRGRISLDPGDGYAPDDERFFTVASQEPIRVAYFSEGKDDISHNTLVKTALMPNRDASGNRHRLLPIDPESSVPLRQTADVLLLDQGKSFSKSQTEKIRQFQQDGGGILVFLGPSSELEDWEKEWLDVQMGERCSSGPLSGQQHFGQIKFTHPILQPFSQPGAGDLFHVSVRSWRRFQAAGSVPLIRLTNGDPILSVFSRGRSRVAILAFPLSRDWTDWPLQSTFLPFLHQAISWLTQQDSGNRGLLVGDPATDGSPTDHPGFTVTQAVNVDSGESDLSRWTMLASFDQLKNPAAGDGSVQPAVIARAGADTDIFWWLLMFVGIFSVTELILANWAPR